MALDNWTETPPADPLSAARPTLGLWDATSIIVGIIIGVGFIESSSLVAASAGSPGWTFGVWAIGGATAMLGAACYAELATMLPREGGEYVFLTRAYGGRVGFLFAWTALLVVRPGNIGAMALVFANYVRQIVPLPGLGTGPGAMVVWAVGAVVVLTAINAAGIRQGRRTQNLLTGGKILGLAGLFAAAALAPAVDASAAATLPALPPLPKVDLGLAMVFVLFAYGGWEDVTYVAAEIRDPRRNLRRALLLGTAAVTAIYLIGTAAFAHSLGWAGLAGSKAVAADALRPSLGDGAARAVSLLVAVCALGAVNGMTLTGSRIAYAASAGHPALRALGKWDGRRGVPMRSLLLQSGITVALVLAVGGNADGFERIIIFTVPAFWSFYILVGAALIVLRKREPGLPRPYRVPFYPVTPILFCVTGAYMLRAGIAYAWDNRTVEAAYAIAAVGSGLALMPWASGGAVGGPAAE